MKATELSPWSDERELDVVGRRRPRLDAGDKVRGRARYTADIRLPHQAVGVFVRSPHPHARVESIDPSAALGTPGVVAVIDADSLASAGLADLAWYGEECPFFAETARFVGDEVALVVGETLTAARDGAALVEVSWAPLPHVTDPERSLDDDAPTLHDDTNLADEIERTERGDVDTALADAAVVVTGTFRTPTAVHNALEPHGAVAEWDGDGVTVHCSTQGVNDVREHLADRLGIDHHRVRVVADHVGGGFGAKQVPWKPTVAAVVASLMLGRPVMVMNDRRAENLAAGKRNSTVQRVTIGADDDGRIVAIDADLLADNGAYTVAGEASNVPGSYVHLYRCDNVRTVYRRVYTNTGPAVAFRAPGYVEAAFALESLIDELAERVGVDGFEIRRRNYTDRDQQQDLPWSSPQALETAYQRLEAHAGPSPTAADGVLVGRGLAAADWMAATAMPPGVAWGEFNSDGSVHIATSSQDIGTGTRTILTAIVAEELAMSPDAVRVTVGDTAGGPPAPTSSGSTTTPTMAPAVRAAAAALRRRLLDAAADHLDVDVATLRLDDRTVHGEGDVAITVADLLEEIAPDGIRAEGERVETADGVSPRTHAAALADVEVDPRDGTVRVTRLVVAPDCGRIIDPLLADSQVIGGATQGIGFALMETQLVDHRLGVVATPELETYLVPTIGDTCEIVHAEVGIADLAANPLGVKGIGELPLIPVPAAISNAVAAAIGRRPRSLPLTRAVVLGLLHGGDADRTTTTEADA